jgi:hypothetical protein
VTDRERELVAEALRLACRLSLVTCLPEDGRKLCQTLRRLLLAARHEEQSPAPRTYSGARKAIQARYSALLVERLACLN